MVQLSVKPSLDEIKSLLSQTKDLANPPNLVPLCASISSEFLTPSAIYLKIAARYELVYREHKPDVNR
jgi:anthranilate synthase component 1